MRRESASWESMDCLDSEKRERKEDVASDELVESDRRASELSKRAWWRVERRSSMAWCFFCCRKGKSAGTLMKKKAAREI
ncbi:hypothetical protein QQP08_000902 [Theobroma cacao]|nr:hypothetical protein QQP08_000902 [Theobroma cacao]